MRVSDVGSRHKERLGSRLTVRLTLRMSLGGSLSTTSRTISTGRDPTGVVPSRDAMLDERVDRGS
jgi:hypothetical protein